MEIDGTPGVTFKAGVEEPRRVLQRGALGEGHLHDVLVRLTGADYSRVRPHRNSSPLPLLDHVGVGLLDENSDPSEHLAPPITQFLDSRIYQLRGGVFPSSLLQAALPVPRRSLLHGCCRSYHRISFASGLRTSNRRTGLGTAGRPPAPRPETTPFLPRLSSSCQNSGKW